MSVVVAYAQPEIKGGEYFIGSTDPGSGNGIAFTVVDGAWDELVESIVAASQTITSSSSPFLINIRLKYNSNNWGPLFKKTLFFNPVQASSRPVIITYAEYFFGIFDPGEGNGTPIVAFDGAFDEAVETLFRTKATWTVSSGPILFNIRLKDAYNNWGPLFKKTIFPFGDNPSVNLISQGDTIKVCPNGIVTLNYDGPNGYTPTWFNGANASSITFNATSVGYYKISATLGNSTYQDSIYVAFLPSPTPFVNPSGSVLVCGSSVVILSTPVTANTTYQWYFNSNIINGATNSNYLPTQIGDYYVVATGNNGCKRFSDTTKLFTNASTNPSGSITTCKDFILLNAPNGFGNTYQWKLNGVNITGATSPSLTAIATGNYSVSISNSGCNSTSPSVSVLLSSNITNEICGNGIDDDCDGLPDNVFRFIGSGNFSTPSNWECGTVPTNPLPAKNTIMIMPQTNGNCTLDIQYKVSAGANFTVTQGSKLMLPSNLILQ